MTVPSPSKAPIDLSSLPDWVQKVLKKAPVTMPSEPSVLGLRTGPAWPLVTDAAVVQSFLPQDLGPSDHELDSRDTAEGDVLDYCVVSHEPRGARWTLTTEARTAVLRSIIGSDDLKAAVTRTASRFTDPVSNALRTLVERQTIPDLETLDLETLESLRAAATLVGDVKELHAPNLLDLDRVIDLRRLLSQFERMTGKSTKPAKGAPRPDRFFGREDDLKRLRSFVDVARSQSFFESVQRGFRRLPFIGRTPVTVWGLGGVGKTTLMAKFMLEHAHAAAKETRYPFAYLDFDRSAMSPRNRAGLLIEMTLQIGAQFPELADKMLGIRLNARELARRMDASANADSISKISPFMWDFRSAVDGLLDSLESRFSRPRPFLLVFDTFEVVQYTPSDATALEEFVRGFTPPNETGLWPRLRLVIAGRKEIRRFLGKVDIIELRGIDSHGAEEMLKSLGADGNLALEDADVKRLIAAIARITGGADQGWRPLRLRLIAHVLKQMHDDTPDASCTVLVDRLLAILNDPNEGGAAFIDGILVRRILEHLHDGRVVALADPGLVVRRVSPEVIQNVMAFGTPKPDLTQPLSTIAASDRTDNVDFPPWNLSLAEARNIFEAFKREVSIVEVDNDVLWHRQDVRREMLPLLMVRKKRFRLLHELAWNYHAARVQSQPDDHGAAAEAIYHGLWLEKPDTVLDALWPDDASFNPRIDADEFPLGNKSPLFLKLQTGAVLTAGEARELNADVSLRWLKRRGAALAEEGLSESAFVARRMLRSNPRLMLDDRALGANVAEALYKAGYWADALSFADQFTSRSMEGDTAAMQLLRVTARIYGKVGAPPSFEFRSIDAKDAAATIDINLHLELARRRQKKGITSSMFDPFPRRLREVSDTTWRSDVRLLRLAVLICDAELLPHIQALYVDATDGLPRDEELQDAVRRIARIDSDLATQLAEYISDHRPTFDLSFREAIIQGVHQREVAEAMRYIIAFDHRDWKHPLTQALERALARDRAAVITPMFQDPRLRISSRVTIDKRADPAQARSIIDALLDGGGLLAFARSLRSVEKPFITSAGPDQDALAIDDRWQAYPQDVFSLCAALLLWHDILVRTVAERTYSV
jgi:hypothetical protein